MRLVLETTRWATGEVTDVEETIEVKDFNEATKALEADLFATADVDFYHRVMDQWYENRRVHVQNGTSDEGFQARLEN